MNLVIHLYTQVSAKVIVYNVTMCLQDSQVATRNDDDEEEVVVRT